MTMLKTKKGFGCISVTRKQKTKKAFGCISVTQEQIIKEQFCKYPHFLNDKNVFAWREYHKSGTDPDLRKELSRLSVEEVVHPYKSPFIQKDCRGVKEDDKKMMFYMRKGIWQLTTFQHTGSGLFDFVVACHINNQILSFDAYDLEDAIKNTFGVSAYNQFRKQAKDDLGSLRFLVQQMRNKINFISCSVTCSERASKLLASVGVPVVRGIAFLTPSSYV